MKTVLDHRYAKHPKTVVYDRPSGKVLGYLSMGAWIGVTGSGDEWFSVISTEFDGWIKKEDTIDGEDLKLSIVSKNAVSNHMIQYALSA